MKALLCARPGNPEDLTVADLPDPEAAPGEAVIRVESAALNFFDLLIIAGKYQYKPAHPFSPGAEFAGVVESLGAEVTGFAPGDRVIGYSGWGAARQKLAIAAQRLVKMPAGLDADRGCGLIVTYGTSYYALKNRGGLKRGETLAVLGAAGGTGLAAVELGKLIGARVIACASSDEKLAFTRKHGADETINYASEDLRERIKTITGGRGVDVVYDPVGGVYTEPALRSMAWKGRYLVIGFTTGEIPRPPLNLALLKGCAIVGVFYGGFAQAEPQRYDELMQELLGWLAEGRIRPVITGRYPLERAAEALRLVADRKATGKIMLSTALGRASAQA